MKKEAVLTMIRQWRQDSAFRKKALFLAALAGMYVLIIPAYLWNQSVMKDLKTLRDRYGTFTALAAEYQSLSKLVNVMERKRSLTAAGGLPQVIGDITLSLGIKNKVKSIKGTGIRKINQQMTEESAEVQMEKLNASELVHLFRKIENAPMILSATRVVIKKSFENPDLLDVTTSLSLFK